MLLLWALGCADKALTHIEVDGEADTEVEAGTLLEELLVDFGFEDFVSMDLVSASALQNQGVEPGDISSAELIGFELEAIDGTGDLSFLEELRLSVSAPDLDAVELAVATNFPPGEPVVVFALSGADFAPHVVSREVTFQTDITGHRPSADTIVRARYVVDVGVTIQGAAGAIKDR